MDSNQQAIIQTSSNALHAKAAAVRAGYYDDPYIGPFVQEPSRGRPPHVQPIIKRGTHARVCCIDRVIRTFTQLRVEKYEQKLDQLDEMEGSDEIEEEEKVTEEECIVQVVVLGCGKDTIFFRHHEFLAQHPSVSLKWFEIDHPPIIQEKATTIGANPDVFDKVSVNKVEGETDTYTFEPSFGISCCFIGHDLRDDGVMEKLQRAGCDTDTPTLFILECVLMYLPEQDSQNLLQSVRETFPDAYLCLYEPILGNDAFGMVMENNLSRVGLATPDASLCQTRQLKDQLAKVVQKAGWAQAVACDMWHAYDTILTAEQRQRGNRAEFLDEWEEFILIMKHYCFLVAATGALGEDLCQISKTSRVGFAPGQAERVVL